MTHQPIYIKWRDACFIYEGQQAADAVCRVIIFESVGFLVKEDSDCITIAQDWDMDDQIRCTTTIPTENIIEKRFLE